LISGCSTTELLKHNYTRNRSASELLDVHQNNLHKNLVLKSLIKRHGKKILFSRLFLESSISFWSHSYHSLLSVNPTTQNLMTILVFLFK